MVNWAQMYDCYFETGRVPEFLGAVEREDDAEAWQELGYRLVLEHDLVAPASFAELSVSRQSADEPLSSTRWLWRTVHK
ncbi:hypothetical protein [Streptomyces sp. NPDC060366]|uniref:hypothetical protein n=1 Tax=Streptomyces sp. NPDC060366 TaxID=3347105 RepID=UPI003669EF62